MKSQFKDQVREHIEGRALSEHQRVQLQAKLAGGAPAANAARPAGPLLAVIAAAFALLSFAMLYGVDPRLEAPDIGYRIADEVAANHLRAKPLEVRTDSMAELRRYFDQLDFVPVETPATGRPLRLLGGRYCSLQGETAAQLRLRDVDTGAVDTLYQTEYDPALFGALPKREQGEAPLVVYARGVPVTIWVEKGLVFALTRQPAPAP